MRALVVVDEPEEVELGLELVDAVGGGLGGEAFLEGPVEPFDAPMFVKSAGYAASAGCAAVSGRGRLA